MLNALLIESSVYQFFGAEFSGSPFHIDAEPFDPDEHDTWVQVAVSSSTRNAVRKSGKDVHRVGIVANCWARIASDHYEGASLADQVAAVFDHAVIEVKNYRTSGEPKVGCLTLHEAQIHDLTQQLDEDLRTGWQHYAVHVFGLAVES